MSELHIVNNLSLHAHHEQTLIQDAFESKNTDYFYTLDTSVHQLMTVDKGYKLMTTHTL